MTCGRVGEESFKRTILRQGILEQVETVSNFPMLERLILSTIQESCRQGLTLPCFMICFVWRSYKEAVGIAVEETSKGGRFARNALRAVRQSSARLESPYNSASVPGQSSRWPA